jgi:lipopolysaccharide transport system ATP-binding protein
MSETLVEAEHVSKKFTRGLRHALRHGAQDIGREFFPWAKANRGLRPGEFWALKDIDFQLERGESLAVIGANGAGKSTLLKLISGLLKPDEGRIQVRGKLRAMIELGAAFNPVLSGRENAYVQGTLYGYDRDTLGHQMDAIVDFSGLEEFIDVPVQQYSDGMRARLGFAVAINLEPDVLLVDEVLAVGDIAFQNKCLNHIHGYLAKGGTLVFVGHASHQVQSVCRRSLVLVQGRVAFSGDVVEALDLYLKKTPTGSPSVSSRPGVQDSAGSDSCRITSVGVRGAHGSDSVSSDGMRISVSYETKKDIPDIGLGFNVYTVDGLLVAGGLASPPVCLKSGAGTLEIFVPSVPLFPAEYHLRVSLIDMSINYPVALFGWDEAPHTFVVEHLRSWFTTGSMMAGLNVYMGSEWVVPTPDRQPE